MIHKKSLTPLRNRLEDDGFIRVGRATIEAPANFLVHFERPEARSWGPVLYAFRVADEVLRIGKAEESLQKRMKQWQLNVSRGLAGEDRQGVHTLAKQPSGRSGWQGKDMLSF